MPLPLAFLTGVVDFGWYYDRSMAVIAAAREGARNGATHASTAGGSPCVDAETRTVNSLVSAGFTATVSPVTGSVANDPALGDRLLTVQAQLPQTTFVRPRPLPGDNLRTGRHPARGPVQHRLHPLTPAPAPHAVIRASV